LIKKKNHVTSYLVALHFVHTDCDGTSNRTWFTFGQSFGSCPCPFYSHFNIR